MENDDGQGRPISRLLTRVGKIAAAAAALLAENPTGASESDLIAGILSRNDAVASVSGNTGEPA